MKNWLFYFYMAFVTLQISGLMDAIVFYSMGEDKKALVLKFEEKEEENKKKEEEKEEKNKEKEEEIEKEKTDEIFYSTLNQHTNQLYLAKEAIFQYYAHNALFMSAAFVEIVSPPPEFI